MTSYTSSTIDDQQERHYIGNLLYDDDPFSPPTKQSNTSQQLPVGSVLPGGGPIGPSPNPTFWPEPPPPYSPYSLRPPQWCPVNRQPPDLYNNQLHNSCNQIPGFYQPVSYDRIQEPPREWSEFGSSSLDGYSLLRPNVSYGSHAAFTHHYGGRYVTPDSFQPRNTCFGGPYPSFNPTDGLKVDPSAQLTSGEYFRKENVIIHPKSPEVVPSVPPSLIDPTACFPLGGKSYRDAASEKKRTGSAAYVTPSFSTPLGSYELKKCRRGGQELSSRTAKSATVAVNKPASEISKKTVFIAGSTALRSSNENEFQKITRKKTKGSKSNRESNLGGEEVFGNYQTVDASSRFDVLQSLSNQVKSNTSRTSSVVSVGLHKSHKSKTNTTAKVVNEHSTKIGMEYSKYFFDLFILVHN
ncbi:unnamed protein product [Enterobius vermicularis]|uniref:Uncharacterized protein n=1 Tax=Enterobius vermicularis TaxID=51028 RepID=A0A0N4VJT7_ENTVE|nr:unnamed protein product [Enterobius vermicularis]